MEADIVTNGAFEKARQQRKKAKKEPKASGLTMDTYTVTHYNALVQYFISIYHHQDLLNI
jgi:hypothetical protein